jgi:hypothetical protein
MDDPPAALQITSLFRDYKKCSTARDRVSAHAFDPIRKMKASDLTAHPESKELAKIRTRIDIYCVKGGASPKSMFADKFERIWNAKNFQLLTILKSMELAQT